jgi:hypothetical protein
MSRRQVIRAGFIFITYFVGNRMSGKKKKKKEARILGHDQKQLKILWPTEII